MIPSLPPVDRMADSGWRNRRAIVEGQMAGRRVAVAATEVAVAAGQVGGGG